jgi:hypothetical protein
MRADAAAHPFHVADDSNGASSQRGHMQTQTSTCPFELVQKHGLKVSAYCPGGCRIEDRTASQGFTSAWGGDGIYTYSGACTIQSYAGGGLDNTCTMFRGNGVTTCAPALTPRL